jgi:hypothetical protein
MGQLLSHYFGACGLLLVGGWVCGIRAGEVFSRKGV